MSKRLKVFKKRVEHVKYYNSITPFPVYDTDYVKDLEKEINKMEQSNKKEEYDKLPVAACKYCNSLAVQTDEVENEICMRCGAVNELKMFNNIHEYLKFTGKDE